MYEYVVASLMPEFATEVQDLILTIPVDHPHDLLKASLIKRTAASSASRSWEIGSPHSCSAAFSNSLGTPRATFHHLFFESCFFNNKHMVLAFTSDHLALRTSPSWQTT